MCKVLGKVRDQRVATNRPSPAKTGRSRWSPNSLKSGQGCSVLGELVTLRYRIVVAEGKRGAPVAGGREEKIAIIDLRRGIAMRSVAGRIRVRQRY
jgi:hypothetical protein